MKSFIVDASVVLGFLFEDERTQVIDKLFLSYLDGEVNLHSTQLLKFEVANAFRDAVLRQRIDEKTAISLVEKFEKIHIEEREINLDLTIRKALEENLTFYDASYLQLSKSLDTPLLSFDKHLKKYTSHF